MPENESHISLRQYLESRFDALEKHIDDKFSFQQLTNKDVDKRLCYLEHTKIPKLEEDVDNATKKSMYLAGTVAVVVALVLFLLEHIL